jgi:hypothetical protein
MDMNFIFSEDKKTKSHNINITRRRAQTSDLVVAMGHCAIFLRGQMINCSQYSYTMLQPKLTSGAAKPLKRPEEVLPMEPRSATNGGPPCPSLVPYHERATG